MMIYTLDAVSVYAQQCFINTADLTAYRSADSVNALVQLVASSSSPGEHAAAEMATKDKRSSYRTRSCENKCEKRCTTLYIHDSTCTFLKVFK